MNSEICWQAASSTISRDFTGEFSASQPRRRCPLKFRLTAWHARTVRKGSFGFLVILHVGDHHAVTTEHRFLIPYGTVRPPGDNDFISVIIPTNIM